MNWLRKSARGISESGVPEKEVPGLWNNAGICCGLAGVGDFFLSLYRLTSEKSDLEFARRVAAALLQKGTIEGDKMKWIQAEHRTKPELLVAQTGLMQGAAGIGMFLLHLDALEQGKSKKINLPDSAFLN
jgi:lantibiotic modifying enzyme